MKTEVTFYCRLWQTEKKNKRIEGLRQIGVATTIPFLLASGPLIGYFLGDWLDGKLDTGPYLMVGGVVLGLAASIRETIRLLRRLARMTEEDEKPDDEL